MIGATPQPFWSVVSADLRRYGSGTSINAFVRHFCMAPGFEFTFWLRATSHLRTRSLFWRPFHYLCRWVLHRCSVKYGISIPYNTQIGPGLYIGHYGGIVINDSAILGRDCNVNHAVTVGVKYGGSDAGVPVIGDRVFLAPGCKVFGGIRLGNDVAIGANAVVLDSVPDSGVAAGVPAKLISLRGSSDYVVNVDPRH